MSSAAKQALAALAAGVLFGVGLAISGMTRPEKVIGFLDVFGAWDASLALVMAGAVGVHLIAYRVIRGRPSPLWATKWSLPTRRDVDGKLVGGAALFGVGWGVGGYCPGPAIVSLGSGAIGVFVFVAAMAAGMWIASWLERAAVSPSSSSSESLGDA